VGVGNVKTSGAIVTFNTVVAVVPKASVAVIVTGVATKDDVGVPVRCPVDVENVIPYVAKSREDEYVTRDPDVEDAKNRIGLV
jgi:hypothetical protein